MGDRRPSTGRRHAAAASGGTRNVREDVPVVPQERVLLWAAVVLCCISVVMVYSASAVFAQREYGNTWAVVARHALYVVLGAAAAWGASRISLRVWRDTLTPLVLAAAVASMALLQFPGFPLATTVNGANRWIRLGPLGFQPSELAKLALVLWFARFLAQNARDLGSPDVLRRALVVFGCLAGLVMWGNDMGTTVLLGVVFLAMLFLAGAPPGQVGLLASAMAGVSLLGLFVFEGFRTERVMAFLRPDEHVSGAGYQVLQSQIGFASGGVFGAGPGLSRVKWGFLPEAHTDFILAVIGEELGLVGSLVVLGALVAVVGCGILIGLRCADPFGRLVAFGLSCWLAVQAVVNVGVSVGAMPTKGIPLPFVSYGGTAMITSLVAIGVLLAVSRAPAPSRTPARRRR